MLDFTSALYLGMRHPSGTLRPWRQFTTGVPAALASPALAHTTAQALASLQGCEAATFAPSTLHLFWDLFRVLTVGTETTIYMDAGTYPIAHWGVERVAARGVRVRRFGHHDAQSLATQILEDERKGARPLVVTDGFCPSCGRLAPISDYLRLARERDGRLILDDTQALGLLGHTQSPSAPYGMGGGGVMRYHNIAGPEVLVVSSLAKGFGVPMAALSGSRAEVQRFEAKSDTRVHCSPPSIAVLHAAAHALEVNFRQGEALRLRLARLVRRFRQRLRAMGLSAIGGLFPVQTIAPRHSLDALAIHERLQASGIRTVLRRSRRGPGALLTFVITATHHLRDIDRAADALASVAAVRV
jgi:8-amino-7-oxononanoate synthase